MDSSRSNDKMFEKLGIDEDDLKLAIDKHGLSKDPEFIKITQEVMTRVQ